MAYSNTAKVTSESYALVDKQELTADTTIAAGTPIGLLLALTYATQQTITSGYDNTNKQTSESFSNTSKQSSESYANTSKQTSQSYSFTSET